MDTNNKTRDVDALLQKALRSTDKPDAELIRKVTQHTNKEETIINRPRFKRSIRRVAAVIAASLALTTTVFAAGTYLGSFDRLREVVGNQRADVLQPLEIASDQGGYGGQGMYESGANAHEAQSGQASESITAYGDYMDAQAVATDTSDAGHVNVIGNSLAEAGIHAELVAIGVFDNVVDVYITLQDLTGNRLDNYFQVQHVFGPVGNTSIASLGLAPEIINRTDCGIVTIRTREIFTQSVAGMEFSYSLLGIRYNMTEQHSRPQFRDLEIDFTAVTNQPSVLFRPDASPAWSGGGSLDDGAIFGAVETQMVTEGFLVLQPHLHNIEIDIGGETVIISSIGIIEDRLHIQFYRPVADLEHPAGFMLYDYANLSSVTMSFGFAKDGDGNLVRAEVGAYGFEAVKYREYILFNVDLERLADYRLRGAAFGPIADHLPLEWSVIFEVEANDVQLVADGLDVQYGSATVTEVRITTFLIQVVLDAEAGMDAPPIIVHTTSGTVHPPAGMRFSGSGAGNFFYDMGDSPLDLDNIISVEIGGERVVFYTD